MFIKHEIYAADVASVANENLPWEKLSGKNLLLTGATGLIGTVLVDVWMKKCLKAMYPEGIPDFVLPYAGIAQQYLFHYSRTSGIFD